ncbi:hypothetical protein DEI95_07980 [Curtobacterium sp. MCBD17_008]|nr:hypothetical protein DEI95_07980 [Curtobacterium sp. MCBD17_008]
MSAMELKGRDGTATLTDDHIEFRFAFSVRSAKMTKGVRIPLAKVEYLEYEDHQLRVRAKGWSRTPEPKRDGLTFRFNRDGSGEAFADAVSNATGVPFTDLTTDVVQWRQEQKEQARRESENQPERRLIAPAGAFQGYYFEGSKLAHGSRRWRMEGATATVDGTVSQRSSTGRTLGGALVGGLLVGGTGAVVGAVAGSGMKKNTSKRYLTIATPDETIVVPFPSPLERQAWEFAARINSWGR